MTSPGQNPPPQAAPASPRGNGLGVAALVLGIISLALCWIPLINIMFIICGIIGMILGGVGAFVSHRVMSIVGAGLGLAGVILAILVNTVFIDDLDDAVNEPPPTVEQQYETQSADDADTKQESTENEEAEQEIAEIGQTVHAGDFSFTVTDVSHASSVADQFGKSAQGEYTILHLTITNTGDESVMVRDGNQTIVDTEGKRYDPAWAANMYLNQDVFLHDINPGNTVEGQMAFDM